jgi:hypothetical protein
MDKKSEKVSAVLGHITFGVWVLFGVSWIMSYFPSLADVFPASHFWWILLAGIIVHGFSYGYQQQAKRPGMTQDWSGKWSDSETKHKDIPVSQKVLVCSGLKNMLGWIIGVTAIVAGLAIWGHTIGWGDEGCVEYYAGYDTGWSDVCVAYKDDYYEEQEPYSGYNDSYDQDCADIGRRVYVGSYDPDGLDRDGDGYGCESYGG